MTGRRTSTGKRVALVLAITVGMLAGSTIGAVAQLEDVEPVGFTGQLHEYGGECAGTYEVVDGVRHTRGYCYQLWMGTTDPRFTGALTRVVNVDEYVDEDFLPDGDVSLWVSMGTYRLENESGTWHGDATVSVTVDDVREGGEVAISAQTIVFTGTGDYEGLTAVVWWQPGGNLVVRGVIFPGSPPLPPVAESFDLLPTEE